MGMAAVFIVFAFFGFEKNFLSVIGSSTWVNHASAIGIIAIPVGFLMIAGELDISVGAVLPASAMTMGITSGYYELPIWLGMIFTLSIAAFIGWVNGMLVTRTSVPSLIVTLGTLFAVAGLTLSLSILLTNTTQVALYPPDWAKAIFGGRYFGGFRSSVLWWIFLTVVFIYVLHYSKWGNWIFALGGDQESARNAGIPTDRLKIALFILVAVCTALAGICQSIQFNSAQSSTNFTLIFNTIIAVVVGGVLLTGGFGSVMGIFFGTLTLGIVQQGINFTNIDRNLSSLIIGVMLLIAVLMNDTFRNLATNWSTSKKKS
ncbi:ABC transporter permease [Hoeflea prorocentri]|uniref:Xylose transport system permease protein XylH n=1 Tax=Hoeflea prorocentri TaxID=1922333 RepID=A0A9X3UPG5_9HYPH|nr:ABC transporter permease [Hoeflea prorocentri]MCY6382806.1 ABC transporter permease [Hoeflea prorocentri]MDA5400606.1 ABC transporter permease [Hoeflea prorocentri]